MTLTKQEEAQELRRLAMNAKDRFKRNRGDIEWNNYQIRINTYFYFCEDNDINVSTGLANE